MELDQLRELNQMETVMVRFKVDGMRCLGPRNDRVVTAGESYPCRADYVERHGDVIEIIGLEADTEEAKEIFLEENEEEIQVARDAAELAANKPFEDPDALVGEGVGNPAVVDDGISSLTGDQPPSTGDEGGDGDGDETGGDSESGDEATGE